MIVRVRPKSLSRLLLAMVADLLILSGIGGVLVWAWGLSEGALYQYAQGVQFATEVSDAEPGNVGNPAAPQRGRRWRFLRCWHPGLLATIRI